ncbi:hypothetical protein QBC39DRAFT_341195 [Podospora conica]|nr:hypothetical protein QBC39DRAFT_341195 [Schizothecium conicum]
MANSSPGPGPRRSVQYSSPQRSMVLADIMNEDRNSVARHKSLLEAARKEHERVREEAERVYTQHQKKEETQRLLKEKQRLDEERRKEEERIRLEEQVATDRMKLLALKEKKVEIPPIPAEPPKQASPPAVKPPPATAPSPTPTPIQPTQANGVAPSTGTAAAPATSGLNGASKQASLANLLAPTATTSPAAKPNPFAANGPKPAASAPAATQPASQPPIDRLTVIHQNLKQLRKAMAEQAKVIQPLRARMGDMRREIRKCVGQLTGGGPATNRPQLHKILAVLREALSQQLQSNPIDPSLFVQSPRNPVQGAAHNDMLPSLFLYLLNILAKAAISQFVNEASAKPETADPIGVCLAATFSEPEFHWRGESMIDILLAKYRIVCPVLFGYRGSEKTEQGRKRLGWWKNNGTWVSEQQHMDRMTGLGAGYASISLRKFTASKKKNPYPARHYWESMARIVNTPAAEISDTQCIVLQSMIKNYPQKFMEAYGTAALAALRICLVEFPARAPQKSPSVKSLEVLAQMLKKDMGLSLV